MKNLELKTKRGTRVEFEVTTKGSFDTYCEVNDITIVDEINILSDKWCNPNGINYDLFNEYTFIECEDADGFTEYYAIIR